MNTICEGIRSPSDNTRPAPICRDCARRIAWKRYRNAVVDLVPAAVYVGALKLRATCGNKVKA